MWGVLAELEAAGLVTVGVKGLFSILETDVLAGAPGRTRTCDRLLRRQLLYPAELQAPGAILPGPGYAPTARARRIR